MSESSTITLEGPFSSDIHKQDTISTQKFGTFLGAFLPCILMLFGVIIFLRLGWIVGQVGLLTSLFIISFAAVIALITSLSMSAIATNIEVGKGGVYYMLSRSLGAAAGSAVGIPLYFNQCISIAFCITGFAESVNDLVPSWSITSIGISTLAVLTFLAYTSIQSAMKVQVAIFITIVLAFISLFAGTAVEPMHPNTFIPEALPSIGFWGVFAIFFPAMTGLESSVSLSGDLRNPSKSLPLGTISALLVSYIMYIAISLFLVNLVPMTRLAQDPLVMQDIAKIPSLITLGIWGATLSSALGGLLGAPRTLQAISEDGILPKIFSRTYGKTCEPKIATLVTCSLAFLGIYYGSVNLLAPLLTMICLICYAVLNFSAGVETLMANPSWRPRFNVHWAIPLLGALCCVITMLMIDAGAALLSLLFVTIIYYIVSRRNPQSQWVDIRKGIIHFFSRWAIYKLSYGRRGLSKSWRPHFLVFTKFTKENSTSMLKFAEGISQSKGFLTMASFVAPGSTTLDKREELEKSTANRFKQKNIQAFVKIKESNSILDSMTNMIEYYGLGSLTPNTIVFGGIKKEDESADFVQVLRTAFDCKNNIVIMNDDNNMTPIKTGILRKGLEKNIHVWWDHNYQSNSELMLVLAYMVQRNPAWKNTRIYLLDIASSEPEKQMKINKFKELSVDKRLPLDVEIILHNNSTPQERFNLLKQFSNNAELIFIGLNPPPKLGEPIDGYIDYLHQYSHISKELQSVSLVLSSEHTPLEYVL